MSEKSIPAFTLTGVRKVFNLGGKNEVVALEGIDLTVAQGDFITLIGPSGCGKSTLLRLVAELIPSTDGDIEVFGKTAHQARLDQDHAMAFQSAGLFDWRTVRANIELPLELKGWAKASRRERSEEMLQLVKLSDFADHYPWQLSGGMQQRVAIARCLALEPKLLLMDEPFGALDEMTREHMQSELLSIYKQLKATIVFVTHSVPEAVFLSTKVVVMSPRPGRVHSVIDIDLGSRDESTRNDSGFFAMTREVREALHSVEASAA